MSELPTAVPIEELSAALDEIYRLRRALAYEAGVARRLLSYLSIPKGAKELLVHQAQRCRAAATGNTYEGYSDISDAVLRYWMHEAGAKETLTRRDFQIEQGGEIYANDR